MEFLFSCGTSSMNCGTAGCSPEDIPNPEELGLEGLGESMPVSVDEAALYETLGAEWPGATREELCAAYVRVMACSCKLLSIWRPMDERFKPASFEEGSLAFDVLAQRGLPQMPRPRFSRADDFFVPLATEDGVPISGLIDLQATHCAAQESQGFVTSSEIYVLTIFCALATRRFTTTRTLIEFEDLDRQLPAGFLSILGNGVSSYTFSATEATRQSSGDEKSQRSLTRSFSGLGTTSNASTEDLEIRRERVRSYCHEYLTRLIEACLCNKSLPGCIARFIGLSSHQICRYHAEDAARVLACITSWPITNEALPVVPTNWMKRLAKYLTYHGSDVDPPNTIDFDQILARSGDFIFRPDDIALAFDIVSPQVFRLFVAWYGTNLNAGESSPRKDFKPPPTVNRDALLHAFNQNTNSTLAKLLKKRKSNSTADESLLTTDIYVLAKPLTLYPTWQDGKLINSKRRRGFSGSSAPQPPVGTMSRESSTSSVPYVYVS